MELTESEKKGLKRFSLLLESLSDAPWELRIWFDDGGAEPLQYNRHFHNFHASDKIEIDLFMEAFLDNNLRRIENDDIIYDNWTGDDDYCRGYIVFEINPKEKKFIIRFDYEVETTDNYNTQYDFSNFLDMNDEEENIIKNYTENNIEHRVVFDGGGDSGFIEQKDDTTGDDIPNFIYDMLYEILESDYGGWEINNGSHGHFEVDYKNEVIHCNISMYDTGTDEKIIEIYSF